MKVRKEVKWGATGLGVIIGLIIISQYATNVSGRTLAEQKWQEFQKADSKSALCQISTNFDWNSCPKTKAFSSWLETNVNEILLGGFKSFGDNYNSRLASLEASHPDAQSTQPPTPTKPPTSTPIQPQISTPIPENDKFPGCPENTTGTYIWSENNRIEKLKGSADIYSAFYKATKTTTPIETILSGNPKSPNYNPDNNVTFNNFEEAAIALCTFNQYNPKNPAFADCTIIENNTLICLPKPKK